MIENKRALASSIFIAVLAVSSSSRAEPSSAEKSVAESLFQEGKSLMAEGKLDTACPKLAESQRIDPGAGTLTALALCHRAAGKTATAWSEFREVLSFARRDGRKDREQVAQENIAELEPKLSRLRIVVDPAAEAQRVEVRVDETNITRVVWNQAFPVDPGQRRVVATAPGKKPFETTLNIGNERDEKTVKISALEDDPRASASVSDRGGAKADTKSGTSTQRIIGDVVTGVGVVGLGVGAVFGLRAMSKNNDSDRLCPPGAACTDPAGVAASEDAKSAATIANIGIIGGAVLVVTGLVLVITSPSSSPAVDGKPARAATNGITIRPSVLGLTGRF